jgi:hypothetical protein
MAFSFLQASDSKHTVADLIPYQLNASSASGRTGAQLVASALLLLSRYDSQHSPNIPEEVFIIVAACRGQRVGNMILRFKS